MKARNFRYIRPASLEHAYRILQEGGGDAVPIAGGQSLVAGLNMRLSAPNLLVDIGELKELAVCRPRQQGDPPGRLDPAQRAAAIRARSQAPASPHAGRRAHRPCGDPQSRHARREPRLCRSGSRAAGLLRGARGHDRAGLARGRAGGHCRRLLQGSVRNRSPAGRTDRRGEVSGGAAEHRGGFRRTRAPPWRLRPGGTGGGGDDRGVAGSRRPGWSISAASTARGSRGPLPPRSQG